MKTLARYSSILITLLFVSCQQSLFTKFDKDYSYYIYFKSRHTDVIDPKLQMICQIKMLKNEDSIFWNSYYFTEQGFAIIDQANNGFKSLLYQKASLKDTLHIIGNAEQIFKDFFQKPLPSFLKTSDRITSIVYIDTLVKTVDTLALEQYYKQFNTIQKENFQIQDFLNRNKDKYKVHGDVYIAKIASNNGEVLKKGDLISVNYTGYFLDGLVFDKSGNKTIDFELGEQSQLINGLMKAIYLASDNDSLSVVLPSRLAFGENGSSDGFIKPYTPLRYEICIKKKF